MKKRGKVVDLLTYRSRRIHRLADTVALVYEDYEAERRIREKSFENTMRAFPEIAELRHQASHEVGGIYEDKTCPQCGTGATVHVRRE